MTENFRTTKEISELLKVSEETVRRWIRSGDLEAVLDGKSYLVEEKVLEKFIKEKAKVAGTSIAKMAGLASVATAASAAVNPLIGAGILGVAAAFLNKAKKSGETNGKIFEETFSNSTFELKDIEDYIQVLGRKRKKIELEFQMKLLEIDDEIANYKKLKEQIEKGEIEDEKK